MVSFSLLAALTAVAASSTNAAGLPGKAKTPDRVVPPPFMYLLKTNVISGDSSFQDLYVAPYHTGAGLNVVSLIQDLNQARNYKGYLNATYQQFTIGSPEIPYGLSIPSADVYEKWGTAEINGGKGDMGFYFDKSGLASKNAQFAGWLACDWNRGVSQLFWLRSLAKAHNVPCNCATIELLPVAVPTAADCAPSDGDCKNP